MEWVDQPIEELANSDGRAASYQKVTLASDTISHI